MPSTEGLTGTQSWIPVSSTTDGVTTWSWEKTGQSQTEIDAAKRNNQTNGEDDGGEDPFLSYQKEKGIAISGDTDYGVRLIKGLGYKFKKPGSIVKKAETLYTAKIRAKSGQKIAQYDKNHQDNLKHLQRKADSLRNDHTIVIQMGTAYPSKVIRAILEAVLDKESYPNHYAVQLVDFHNADSSMEKLDGREHASVKRIVRGVLE